MHEYLFGVEKPGRYLASEINAFRKNFDQARVRFALAFPDVYEVGMSHLGLKLLYEVLNQIEGVMADRVYAPWFDLEKNLRQMGEPLRGLETERPLRDFDFVGFSLQYELSYTNILTMLDLGGIPLRAAERGPEDPWVIAGGPCAFNPEPLAEIFDFVVLGEAEEVLPELIEAFRGWQARKGERQDFLEEVRKIGGIYVPSFFRVSYQPDGIINAVEPRHPDYTAVTKRLIAGFGQGFPHLRATPCPHVGNRSQSVGAGDRSRVYGRLPVLPGWIHLSAGAGAPSASGIAGSHRGAGQQRV